MTLSLNRLRDIHMLGNPFRYVKSWKTKLRIAFIFFIAISFVLLFLEPFKTGESPKVLVLGYSVSVLTAYLMVLLAESLLFHVEKRWAIKEEAVMFILFFVLSAIGVYWYDLVIIKDQSYYWGEILSFTGRVTLPFAIMFLPLIGWMRYYYGKIYERPEQYQVVIKGNVKADVLEMDQRNILYVRSSDNYVIVKYIEADSTFKEALLRSTLAQVGEQLPDFLKCHRSYLINPLHLRSVEGNQKKALLKLNRLQEEIPLSKTYYSSIKARLTHG